ncbi:aminotransferase class I/II-fold pyridoxal phosphate-dependent enzyme, partial [bacterium]|nr:aminotransferase class I/II-fold pyridoxal phosphate-dependent enzyme [bacterium]
ELAAIAAVVLKHPRLVVISDEIYENLIYDESVGHTSIAELSQDIKERTIVINGVSKSHAMTGWRIGYAAAASEIADKMGQFQSHITSNPTTPSQYAATEALNSVSPELATVTDTFNQRRNIMVDTLNSIPGITCLSPQGAFYAFPNISGCFGKTTPSGKFIEDSASFCKALLEDAFVACVPGSGFGTENYIRISYATSTENIVEGLSRLKQFVATLK